MKVDGDAVATHGFDGSSDVIDQLCATADEAVTRADVHQVSLGFCPAMTDRCEELWIQSAQTRKALGVDAITLAVVGVDQTDLAGVGHQHFVAACFQHAAHPGRVGTNLDHDAHRRTALKLISQCIRCGTKPPLLDDAARVVQETKAAVAVAEIQSNFILGKDTVA